MRKACARWLPQFLHGEMVELRKTDDHRKEGEREEDHGGKDELSWTKFPRLPPFSGVWSDGWRSGG